MADTPSRPKESIQISSTEKAKRWRNQQDMLTAISQKYNSTIHTKFAKGIVRRHELEDILAQYLAKNRKPRNTTHNAITKKSYTNPKSMVPRSRNPASLFSYPKSYIPSFTRHIRTSHFNHSKQAKSKTRKRKSMHH